MLIKSVSGIRGIVGDGIDPEIVLKFSASLGRLLGGGKIFVGRDSRSSGEILKKSVIAGLTGVGADVIDIGINPTPTLLYNVRESSAKGGIVITASHNPEEWNALKLVGEDGEFLKKDKIEEFFKLAEKKIEWNRFDGIGNIIPEYNALENHINGVLNSPYIDKNKIKDKNFTVVMDCVNGGASFAYPEFLESLDIDVHKLYCDINRKFDRNPEPSPENLSALCKKVKEVNADIGFATDPDGDRLSIVSDRGVAIGEENTIVLSTELVLKKKKGPVVINLSTTKAVEDIARRAGVRVLRAPVGEANVVNLMKRENAVIGGEGNGGIINPSIQYTRDAMGAIALILQLMAERKSPISEIINTIPRYKMIKDTIKFDNSKEGEKIFSRIKEKNSGRDLNLDDGMRFEEGESWVHVRMSGTEPVIRVIAESPTLPGARKLIDKIKKQGE